MYLLISSGSANRTYGPFIDAQGNVTECVDDAARFESIEAAEAIGYRRRSTDRPLSERLVRAASCYALHAFECINPNGTRAAYMVAAADYYDALRCLVSSRCVRVLRYACHGFNVDDAEARTQVLCGITGREAMEVYFSAPDGDASPLSWFGDADAPRAVDVEMP